MVRRSWIHQSVMRQSMRCQSMRHHSPRHAYQDINRQDVDRQQDITQSRVIRWDITRWDTKPVTNWLTCSCSCSCSCTCSPSNARSCLTGHPDETSKTRTQRKKQMQRTYSTPQKQRVELWSTRKNRWKQQNCYKNKPQNHVLLNTYAKPCSWLESGPNTIRGS